MKKNIFTLCLHSMLFLIFSCLIMACEGPEPGKYHNPAFVTTWRTDNKGTSDSDQITIPARVGYEYNYDIDWGDGQSDSGVTGQITHTYSEVDTYTVSITGDFPTIYFRSGIDSNKILTIENWGDIKWETLYGAFQNCNNLDCNAGDTPDLSGVSDMRCMFWDAVSFSGDLSKWDVGNAELMNEMFYRASSFNGDISAWDVSSVSDMNLMFYEATSFDCDISGWSVGNVTSMAYMFFSASSFTNHDLSGWNVSQVSDHLEFSTGWGSGNTEPIWP